MEAEVRGSIVGARDGHEVTASVVLDLIQRLRPIDVALSGDGPEATCTR